MSELRVRLSFGGFKLRLRDSVSFCAQAASRSAKSGMSSGLHNSCLFCSASPSVSSSPRLVLPGSFIPAWSPSAPEPSSPPDGPGV